jgi:hypothetical protein
VGAKGIIKANAEKKKQHALLQRLKQLTMKVNVTV